MERDVHDEWQFAKRGARERIKFTSRLTAHGDDLREVALAGCGLVRLLGCHVEDELRSGALVQVLPDWECLGGLPIVAIYRKARSTLSPVNAFGSHLARATTMSPRCVPSRPSPRLGPGADPDCPRATGRAAEIYPSQLARIDDAFSTKPRRLYIDKFSTSITFVLKPIGFGCDMVDLAPAQRPRPIARFEAVTRGADSTSLRAMIIPHGRA